MCSDCFHMTLVAASDLLRYFASVWWCEKVIQDFWRTLLVHSTACRVYPRSMTASDIQYTVRLILTADATSRREKEPHLRHSSSSLSSCRSSHLWKETPGLALVFGSETVTSQFSRPDFSWAVHLFLFPSFSAFLYLTQLTLLSNIHAYTVQRISLKIFYIFLFVLKNHMQSYTNNNGILWTIIEYVSKSDLSYSW